MLDLEKVEEHVQTIVDQHTKYSGHGYIVSAKEIPDMVAELKAHLVAAVRTVHEDWIDAIPPHTGPRPNYFSEDDQS